MTDNKTIFTIEFEEPLVSEDAERLEDKLAKWLSEQGYTGIIWDGLTGNSASFEGVHHFSMMTLQRPPRTFNPQPKPQKRK